MIRIQKQLVVHEDCEFGFGTVTQMRTENNSIVEKDYNRINAGNIPALDGSGIETDIQAILDYLMSTNITNFQFANVNGDVTVTFQVADPVSSDDAVNLRTLTSAIHAHKVSTNPHNVTKFHVGLGSVDNTADIDKPISSATQDALDTKADISHSNDFTNPHNVDAYQVGALPITGGNVQGDLFVEGSRVVTEATLLSLLGGN